jgi:MoaA/NifB/PqqE/SkfB family radical SAM enzyme
MASPSEVTHLYLEVTRSCDRDCSHCSVRGQSSSSDDPPYEGLVSVLAGFRDAGGAYATFSGGEPGLRRDLADLILEAGSLGFGPTVFTNGLAVRDPVLSALSRVGGTLALSLDGPSPAIHEALRGRGTYRLALARLRRAIDLLGGRHVILSCVLSRPLLPELIHLWQFAAAEGPGTLYLGIFEPVAVGVCHPLAPSGYEIADRVAGLLDLAERQSSPRLVFSESDDLIQGRAVFSRRSPEATLGHSVKVQADGWALPGPFYYAPRFHLGRPMQDGWRTVLESPVWRGLELQSRRRAVEVGSCRRCFWSQHCGGGSLPLTWATYGSWTRPCPLCWLYQVALDRGAAKELSREATVQA